jgi:hypothetical protein
VREGDRRNKTAIVYSSWFMTQPIETKQRGREHCFASW